MITFNKKDREVDISLTFSKKIGGQPTVAIHGVGDDTHHLIEGLFDIIDKLANMEEVGHQSEEWLMRRLSSENSVIIKVANP